MADDELQAIRAQRMAQMRAQQQQMHGDPSQVTAPVKACNDFIVRLVHYIGSTKTRGRAQTTRGYEEQHPVTGAQSGSESKM